MSVKDVVAWSSVGRSLLYDEIRRGELKAFKLRGRTLIRRADAEAWLSGRLKPLRLTPFTPRRKRR